MQQGFQAQNVMSGKRDHETAEEPEKGPIILQLFNQIRNSLLQKKVPDKAIVVGINGIDASGKTSFAEAFAKHLDAQGFGVQVIHVDDFQNPKEVRYASEDQIDNYFNRSWNLKQLVDELLSPIHAGEKVMKSLTLLDIATDEFTTKRNYEIGYDTIILLEGVFLFRPELVDFLDYKIFIHVSFEEAKRRIILRDSSDIARKIDTKYHPTQRKYLHDYKPEENANMVIDNTDWNNPRILKN